MTVLRAEVGHQPVPPESAYHALAAATGDGIHSILRDLAKTIAEPNGDYDAGPLLQGALAGLLQFWAESEADDAVLRFEVSGIVDHLLPQIRMGLAARSAPQGTA